MKRSEEGGYDTWGVRWPAPNGGIREFSTKEKAVAFARRMEGQDVIRRDGTLTTWAGLTIVHRFIPEWTEVTSVHELLDNDKG